MGGLSEDTYEQMWMRGWLTEQMWQPGELPGVRVKVGAVVERERLEEYIQ